MAHPSVYENVSLEYKKGDFFMTSEDIEFLESAFIEDSDGEIDNFDDLGSGKENKGDASEAVSEKALEAHYCLPLDGHPSQEKLERIYDMIHSGDKEARNDGITLLLGCTSSYILSIIKKRYRTYMPLHLADMMQQGYYAIIRDADKYDPAKGAPTTFFQTRINHEIQAYINNLHNSTPHFTSAAKKIRACIARKKAKGLSFTLQDLCIETGQSMTTILGCVRIKESKNVSLESTEIIECMQSSYRTPEEIVMSQQDIAFARRLLDETDLTDRERICICMRYGVGMEEDRNRSYVEVQEALDEYGYHMSINDIQKTIADVSKKIRIENGKIKRASACRRIRTDIDRRISGDMISKMSLLSDQEAVAEYFRTGLLDVE